MKKLLMIALLMLALVFTVVACTEDKPPVETPDGETTATEPQATEPQATEPQATEPQATEPQATEPQATEPQETEPQETEPQETEPEPPAPPYQPVNFYNSEALKPWNSSGIESAEIVDGVLHIVPNSADPQFLAFTNVVGARFVAIRYRTADATGADIQFYIGSTGTGPTDDTSMMRQPVIADGEWHLAIFDTQPLIDAGKYDGSTVAYFRFDPLEAGYILDENGEPQKPDGQNYLRYELPAGCSIDLDYLAFFDTEEHALTYDFEMNKAPMWDTDKSVVVHQSFDQFYYGDGGQDDAAAADSPLNLYHAANKPDWNKVANMAGSEHTVLTYWGWVAITAETVGQFGYQVNMDAPIFNDAWTVEAEQGVLDAAKSMGGTTGSRMRIHINTADFDGETKVRVLYKDAEGNTVCLNEITVIAPVKINDITNTFASDISSVEVGTALNSTDLANYFTPHLNLGNYLSVDGAYVIDGISELYANVNGMYALSVNFPEGSNGDYAAIVRGVHAVNSTQGDMKINNFYETDGAYFGGAGIYATIAGGNLKITLKVFDASITTCVKNVTYTLPCDGTELIMADDSQTVYIVVDGKLYATIAISGETEYPADNLNLILPETTFAKTAVVTLCDGTTETLTDTLIDSTCDTQIAIAVRGGSYQFNYVKVEGFSAVEIPDLKIDEPETNEPETNEPVNMFDAEALKPWNSMGIESAEIVDGVLHIVPNGADPQFLAFTNVEGARYIAIRYRSADATGADIQFYIGSTGSGPTSDDSMMRMPIITDGEWHLAIFDTQPLIDAGVYDGQYVSYFRFDPLEAGYILDENGQPQKPEGSDNYLRYELPAGCSIDLAYLAFFNTAEDAQAYDAQV